jgi:hypothetical protein
MKDMKRGHRRNLTEQYRKRQMSIYRSHYGEAEWFMQLSRFGAFCHSYGRFRKQSSMDCGKAGCASCRNNRFNTFVKGEQKITIPERLNTLSFNEQLDDYFGEKYDRRTV